MKKLAIIMLCLLVVILFFIWNKTALINPLGIIYSYKTEWGINVPMPEKREEVWQSEASFHGDGEWVNIFQYSKQKISIEDSGMIALSTDNVDEAKNKIEHFITTTISMYQLQGKDIEQIKKAFAYCSINSQVGDFYFYRENNGGLDYFIALFKQDENKLYTFEWHQ